MTMVTGLFTEWDRAERAFRSVVDLGYDKGEINVVMSDEVRQQHFLARTRAAARPDAADLEKAAAGAGDSADDNLGGPVGGTVGTLTPVVAAMGVLLIPGLGIAAGPLAIALGAAAATGVAVGLMGFFRNWGIPDARVEQYEAGIRAGGILLGVQAHSDADALQIQQRWRASGGQLVHT